MARDFLDAKHAAFVKLARCGEPLLPMLEGTADNVGAWCKPRREPAIKAPHRFPFYRFRDLDFHFQLSTSTAPAPGLVDAQSLCSLFSPLGLRERTL
jgi:hypothetical protein